MDEEEEGVTTLEDPEDDAAAGEVAAGPGDVVAPGKLGANALVGVVGEELGLIPPKKLGPAVTPDVLVVLESRTYIWNF